MIFRLISNGLAPLTILGAIAAFYHPPLFLIFKQVFLWLFAATMFALGVVLQPKELNLTLREPGKIGLGILTQFTVMPLLGFLVAYYSGLPPEIAVGFIIVACAPGAMASNVIVYLAGGAVAYSIALTTVATFLSPLVTPLLVEWLGGVFVPIPFWPMMLTIIKTVLLPLLLGMLVRRLLNRRTKVLSWSMEAAPALAAICIIIICSYVVAANQQRIASVGMAIIGWVIVVNALGYIAGWYLARLYRFDRHHQVTLSIEIGMQNAGLGVALALQHFSAETALPGALFAAWSVMTSAGMTGYLRYRHGRQAPLLAE